MMDVLTHEWAVELGWILLQILVVIGPLLIAVAYLTLAERRVIGLCNYAKGQMWLGRLACSSPLLMR